MIKLKDFKDRPFDRVIQLALREIDTQDLSYAMLGWDEDERQIILRNMSKRAAAMLQEEMEEVEGQIPKIRIEAAAEFYLQKLQQHLRYYAQDDEEAKEYLAELSQRQSQSHKHLPRVDISSDETAIQTFVSISKYVKEHGILALAGIEETVDHPVLKKAFQYIIDGWDPSLYQTILERMCTEYLNKMRRQLDMITTGIESLAAGDPPVGMEERLRAFLG